MIAICAMILPGISGSFLLVLMGMYEPTITAIHDRNMGYVVLFGVGAAIGLLHYAKENEMDSPGRGEGKKMIHHVKDLLKKWF